MNSVELQDILLAEDCPKDTELIITALEKRHIANRVIVVQDGAAALDYLNREGAFANRDAGYPAVVLLDLKMPKVDGLEVLERIKSDPKLMVIPIVILTSSAEERDLVNCYRAGVDAYVVKPVHMNEFMEAVAELGVFWAMINQPPPESVLAVEQKK